MTSTRSEPDQSQGRSRGIRLVDGLWRYNAPRLVHRLGIIDWDLSRWKRHRRELISPDGAREVTIGFADLPRRQRLVNERSEIFNILEREFFRKISIGDIEWWGIPFPSAGGQLERIPQSLTSIVRIDWKRCFVWDGLSEWQRGDPCWREVVVFERGSGSGTNVLDRLDSTDPTEVVGMANEQPGPIVLPKQPRLKKRRR